MIFVLFIALVIGFFVAVVWYKNRVDELMSYVTSCHLGRSIKRFKPSPFNIALIEAVQIRLRRKDGKYHVEARTWASKWYPADIPYSESFYGTWMDKSTIHEDSARERMLDMQADVMTWLEQSKTYNDVDHKDAVIEVISVDKIK